MKLKLMAFVIRSLFIPPVKYRMYKSPLSGPTRIGQVNGVEWVSYPNAMYAMMRNV